jgi:hypothetical protein
VNVKSDGPLAAELLEGKLNRLRCPACGAAAQADLPVAYHDPDAQLFALVLPEWARARELEERAALLGRLAEDSSALVPPYVRDPFVVYGPAGLRTLMAARAQPAAPTAIAAAGPAPMAAAPAPELVPAPTPAPPAEPPAAPPTVCTVVEGRVRIVAVRQRSDSEPLEQAQLEPRIMLHRMPDYPLVVLAVVIPSDPEASLCVPLDFRAASGKEVLRALASSFVAEVELHDPTGRRILAREISAPLEDNARFVLSAAQDAIGQSKQPSFAQAARAFAQPSFDRLGRKRHNFAEDSFSQLGSPAQAKLATGIVGYWCEPDNEDYLVLVQSFPLVWWRRIRSRVASAALESGIALPKPLAEQALGEGLVPSRRELWSRILAAFAEVALHLRTNDLDPTAEWENWQHLLRECDAAGVSVDPQVAELARAAGKRAQEIAEAELPAPAENALPAPLGELSEEELLPLLERRELRRDAALELSTRPGGARFLGEIFAIVPKLTRGEAMRVLPALVRFAAKTEPYFIQGLESRKSFVRQGCALGLGSLRSQDGSPALVRLLGEEPTDIWKEVARALGDIGPSAVLPLAGRIKGASGDQRERIAFALAHVSARGGRGSVEALADGRDAATRQVALRALVLHDAAKTADREVKGPEGPREATVIRSFTRRFYEALSGEVRDVDDSDVVETEEAAEVLSDSDVVEVRDDTGRVRMVTEGSVRRRVEE